MIFLKCSIFDWLLFNLFLGLCCMSPGIISHYLINQTLLYFVLEPKIEDEDILFDTNYIDT